MTEHFQHPADPTIPPPHNEHNVTPRYNTRRQRKEGLRSILSTITILVTAPLIAVFLTVFVFQSYQVDGESMESTLSHNDRLIVWKLPKTWSKITGHDYVPQRGDVVVFVEPTLGQFGQDPGKQLIKRVVGLPGERVIVEDGVLTVYNDEFPDGFQPDKVLPYGDVIGQTPLEKEWTIGEDQVFVVGDNRNNSLDSRTFGPVETKNIVGKLVIRVLPIDQVKRF
jgi:signal peptidase I